MGLLLEALEKGFHSAPWATLLAQHTLQVQEELGRWAPHQGSDQQLRGPILALSTGGFQCCCPHTWEETNRYEEESNKPVKPRTGQVQKIVPNFPPICKFLPNCGWTLF